VADASGLKSLPGLCVGANKGDTLSSPASACAVKVVHLDTISFPAVVCLHQGVPMTSQIIVAAGDSLSRGTLLLCGVLDLDETHSKCCSR